MPSSELPRKAALLVNAKARRGEGAFEQVRDILLSLGMELKEAKSFEDVPELQEDVRRHLDAGTPYVIVGGGDGTVGSVAYQFSRKETVLGVLPLGTGNAFTRDLGIPLDLEKACEVMINGKIAAVDMGLIGNRVFVNVATIGLTTLIAHNLDGERKQLFGKAAYISALTQALSEVEPFHVKLELDGKVEEFDCLQLVIGNGRFHAGPFPVTPDASITGGSLAIYALADTDKKSFINMALHLWGGHHVDLPDVRAYRAAKGSVTTDPIRYITVDGEISMQTPMAFGMIPGALRVAVPQDFTG